MTEWLLTDLHIHTSLSDGALPIEEVVKIYGEAGFDAIAITDHLFDTQSPRGLELYHDRKSIKDLKDYFQRVEGVSRWAKQTYDLLVIPGLEICNLLEDYHILGIDLKGPVNPNQDAEGVIKEIHGQDGIVIASHPPLKLSYFLDGDKESICRHPLHLWKYRGRYVDQIDAWEIANREDLFPAVSLEYLPFVANSDFHERPHLVSWKSLIHAEKEKEAIKQAILQRKISLFFFNGNGSKGKPAQVKVFHTEVKPTDRTENGGKAKLLIVDDEKDLVAMLAYNLGKKGYQISTAYNGFEAWEKIELERPDLLILDLIPHIFCHEELMFRTIENLLSNALNFTPNGGKVDITLTPYLQWKQDGFVEISIKDTGIGILEDEIDKIFEPFYRGRNHSTQTGAGLGLSFAKQAVEFHGGKILVQSEPRKGAIFSILLPVRSRIQLPKAPDHGQP